MHVGTTNGIDCVCVGGGGGEGEKKFGLGEDRGGKGGDFVNTVKELRIA